MNDVARVAVTEEAADLPRRLTGGHGAFMFHQSGGCRDGSSPMCYVADEFLTGDTDVHLGDLQIAGASDSTPVWMSLSQFEYWKHTHLSIDVVANRGSGFSVEAPDGVRFLTRSRLFTDAQANRLKPQKPPI
jgi:uncharacterized protein